MYNVEELRNQLAEKVDEGLRVFADGRENYYYNSTEDRNFIHEGLTETQSRTK